MSLPPRARLVALSLAAIAGSMVLCLVVLWRVTPLTGLFLVFLGVPLFILGLLGSLIAIVQDLREHGVL